MACPRLRCSTVQVRCLSVQGEMLPSTYERGRYCSGDDFRSCPTLLGSAQAGRPLSEAEYLRIWLGAADSKAEAKKSKP